MCEELKPCPFCGGKAELMEVNKSCWVECCSCGAMANIRTVSQLAINKWNKRAQPTIAEYLAHHKEAHDKTKPSVVSIASLVEFMGEQSK